MPNLFSVVGDDFFKPFTSVYKETYYEIIKIIYDTYMRELSYGVDRDTLMRKATEYFEENAQVVVDEDTEQDMAAVRDPQSQAAMFLRNLRKCGWIDYETGNDRQVKVFMPAYSVRMAETVIAVGERREAEYQSEIFAIYSLLTNPELLAGDPYSQVISPVYDRTVSLFSALKQLNSSIKGYVEDLTSTKSAEEIVADFGEYTEKIFSKPYHRLYTSDNVLKYRGIILEKLKDLKYTPQILEAAAWGYQKITGETDLDTAREKVAETITYITDSFQAYDSIIKEIETRNARYIQSAVSMSRFKLTNSNNLEGKISRILNYMASLYEDFSAQRLDEESPEEMLQMLNVFKQEYADNDSLKRAAVLRRASEISPVVSVSQDEEDREMERYQEQLRKRARNTLNLSTTNEFVRDLLSDSSEIKASEIPLESARDRVQLILTDMYGYNYSSGYEVEQTENIVDKNGFRYKDFIIREKKK